MRRASRARELGSGLARGVYLLRWNQTEHDMKALRRDTVDAMIDYAERNELDSLTGEMAGLAADAMAELKALVWLGKDQDSPKHWDALVIEAKFQLDDQTMRVLATMPELGAHLRRGLEHLEASGRI
jgi:hypothetical protein